MTSKTFIAQYTRLTDLATIEIYSADYYRHGERRYMTTLHRIPENKRIFTITSTGIQESIDAELARSGA